MCIYLHTTLHSPQRRDDRQYPARFEDTRAPLPQRPDDRHRSGNHYQNERSHWNAHEDHRIPPPRDNQWQNDRFHDQEQEYGYGEGSSSGLIRFPSSDQHYYHHQQHHQQGYKQGSERHSRRDHDERQDSRLTSPPDEYSRDPSAEIQDRPRRRPRTAPNQSVILIGIPPMCNSDDVRSFIDEFKQDPSDPSPVEEVTIVMDKQTGLSKRFGFVRFITLEHARGEFKFNASKYDL
jgi:RNA-binding protein 5/10